MGGPLARRGCSEDSNGSAPQYCHPPHELSLERGLGFLKGLWTPRKHGEELATGSLDYKDKETTCTP
ncbi:hypothetical protein STEG23_004799 [Scotinomys teguina]